MIIIMDIMAIVVMYDFRICLLPTILHFIISTGIMVWLDPNTTTNFIQLLLDAILLLLVSPSLILCMLFIHLHIQLFGIARK